MEKMVNVRAVVALASVLLVSALVLVCHGACAQKASEESYYPATPDPFAGNWEGRWSAEEDVDPNITAQIVALGGSRYQIRIASQVFMRAPVKALIEAKAKGDVLAFENDEIKGEVRDGRITGGQPSGQKTFTMERLYVVSPTMGAAPEADAKVLFDGSNFDAWDGAGGWVLTKDKAMMVTPDASDLVSKDKFEDLRMHIEFRTPFIPKERGQSRGNSGVFVQDKYEVQVLDSFGLEGTYDECGALYKVSAPRVNACLPPTEWQTYDITFHGTRFNDDGSIKEHARITVLHNGILIQDNQELLMVPAWKEEERLQAPPQGPGSIILQSHRSHYVQYRNVWVVDLAEKAD